MKQIVFKEVKFKQELNNWLHWEEVKIKNKQGVVVIKK